MGKKKNLRFIWPKDGYKGRGHRGFFGGLNDILTGKGPDMFLQRGASNSAIRPDFWGNWDSYHDRQIHAAEIGDSYQNGLWGASRGTQRYDPHTRRYVEWSIPHDWDRHRLNSANEPFYPRFTHDESQKMTNRLRQGRRINPRHMGHQWTVDGPKRFRQQHDWFWQEAHRAGENIREGFPPEFDTNPNLRMNQGHPEELRDWVMAEPFYPIPQRRARGA